MNLHLIAIAALVIGATGCTSTNEAEPQASTRAKMATQKLSGRISFSNLPPNFGLSVRLALFPVANAGSPKPFDGDPPSESIFDCVDLYEDIDLNVERTDVVRDIPYHLDRPSGYYYLQVRSLLYRKQDGKVFAQKEDFFFGRRALPLLDDLDSVTLPVEWPSIPLEELGTYGTFKPKRDR